MVMDCFGGMKRSVRIKISSNGGGGHCERSLRGLNDKIRLLQEEVQAIMNEREKESRAYERDMMVLTFKEAEWKQERKRLREEVKRLRKVVEEKEERIRVVEDNKFLVGAPHHHENMYLFGKYDDEKVDYPILLRTASTTTTTASSFLVEQMREERALRDEAVEKWKKLYLAIKIELDDLIQKTHRGDGLYWRAEEEEMIEELKMEVKAKDETIEELKARVALAENEEYKRARELDILRQSLRIMSSKKGAATALSKPKLPFAMQARK